MIFPEPPEGKEWQLVRSGQINYVTLQLVSRLTGSVFNSHVIDVTFIETDNQKLFNDKVIEAANLILMEREREAEIMELINGWRCALWEAKQIKR